MNWFLGRKELQLSSLHINCSKVSVVFEHFCGSFLKWHFVLNISRKQATFSLKGKLFNLCLDEKKMAP